LGKIEKLNAYRLQFDSPEAAEAARKLLSELSDVAKVEDNYRWETPATLETGSGSNTSGPPLKPKLSPDGKYLVVGVIDTAAQTMSAEQEAFVLSRTDIVNGKPAEESLWHGTAMAEEFLRGLSLTDTSTDGSSVRMRLYNTYGANETSTSFDVTRAVFQAADDGATILSLSLGGPDPSPMLQESLRSFTEQGGLVFVAAGNAATPEPYFPAADPSVVAVTAVNRDGDPMAFANWGSYVDVGAPGVTLVPWSGVTWVVTGTSPATALVAGMAAGYAGRTGTTLDVVRGVILREMPFTQRKP
jgi:thermitase